MWINYTTTSFRNLKKNPVLLLVNVIGLALSFCWVLFSAYLVSHELSYDKGFSNHERIFRLDMFGNGKMQINRKSFFSKWEQIDADRNVLLPPALISELSNNFPDVENSARIQVNRKHIVEFDNKKRLVKDVLKADTGFFKIFDYQFKYGSASTAFKSLNSIVITESIAHTMFGSADPMNKIVLVYMQNEAVSYIVSGVLKDLPSNSSFNFSVALPLSPLGPSGPPNSLVQLSSLGIVKLKKGVDVNIFNEKIKSFARRVYAVEIKERGIEPKTFGLKLTPISDTHLDAIAFGWPNQGKKSNIIVISILSIVILIIAAINYSTIQISNSSGRLNEIGVRKTFGASPKSIFAQFINESFLISAFAILLGIAFSIVSLPEISRVLELRISISAANNILATSGFMILLAFCAVLVGTYPAIFLAKNKIVNLINSSKTYRINPKFSQILVCIQFIICFFFLISVLIIKDQFTFIKNKDLGFSFDNIYLIDLYANQATGDFSQLTKNFNSILSSDPSIELVSGGYNINDPGITLTSGDDPFTLFEFRGDKNFPSLFNLRLLEGGFPVEHMVTDSVVTENEQIVINETLHRALTNCPIGIPCKLLDDKIVNGVMKDFNFQALTENISPAYFTLDEANVTTIFFKTDGFNDTNAIKKIEQVWKDLQQNKPIEIVALSDQLSRLYVDQSRWHKVITFATVIAFIISLFGLFGLSSVNSLNMRKEVAIRKVLGAGFLDVILKANSFILKVLILSFLIATPIALYVVTSWLDNFSYRVPIYVSSLVTAFVYGLGLALLTTSYFTVATLNINSARLLREN